MANIFNAGDFEKMSVGDVLVFDKPEIRNVRVDLTWDGSKAGGDLDVCAFLLGTDGKIHEKADLVFFNSERRWMTDEPFDSPNFNPLKGRVSTFEEDGKNYKSFKKWQESTLPLSGDDSVIGSWDDMSEDEDIECGETMHIKLDEVDTRKYHSIIIAVAGAEAIIRQGYTFSDAINPVVTIADADTFNENQPEYLAEYELNSNFPGMGSVCVGKFELGEDHLWHFEAIADAYKGGMAYLAQKVF